MYTQRRQSRQKRDNTIQSRRSDCLRRRRRGRAALEHNDLMAQSGDLGLVGRAGLKCSGKQCEQGNEDRAHCENHDDLTNDLTTSVFSTRTEFSATTGS